MIRVKKRNGNLEPMDITKIQKQTFDATKMLLNVSQSELELDAHIQFTDGISSEDIQKLLIQTAVSKIDIDKPDWTYVGARLTLYDLYHRVGKLIGGTKGHPYAHISKYLDYGFKVDKLHFNLQTTKYNLEKINDAIKPERDDLFTYLGIKTLLDRYLLRNQKGEVFELPQHLFMTVAMFLAQNEKEFPADLIDENKAKYSDEDYEVEARTFRAIQFYDVLSKFEVMLATPTLSNARTNRHQLSSCFVNSVPDNIEGIFDGFKEVALLSKYGGGIGTDWNLIRGMKSAIAGHKGAAGGVVPFLKIDNDIAIAVDQLGTRKGAIAVYLEPWHIDILEFLDLKKNSGEERRRTHDLFPALWISDLFMERALKGEDLSLFSPDDVPLLSETYGEEFNKAYVAYEQDVSINRVTIKAVEIWKKALQQYFETGSPYLCFKDNANRVNPNAHTGHIRSSNLCVSGDTRLATQFGLVKAKDLYESKEKILATYDLRTDGDRLKKGVSVAQCIEMHKTKENADIFEVLTKDGYKIKSTDWHEYYVLRDKSVVKLKLKDIKIGDKLLIQSEEGQFGKEGSYELGLLTGFIAGDGTFAVKKEKNYSIALIDLYNEEIKLKDLIKSSLIEVINNDYETLRNPYKKDIKISDPKEFSHTENSRKVRFTSGRLGRILEEKYNFNKDNKLSVPEFIFKGTKETVKGYLQGLFVSDSCVEKIKNNGIPSFVIKLSSKEIGLLEDVQLLLSNFGIRSKIYKSKRKNSFKYETVDGVNKEYFSNNIFLLSIHGNNAIKFINNIGLLGVKQEKALRIMKERVSKSGRVESSKKEYFEVEIKNIKHVGKEDVYDTTQLVNHSLIFNGLVTGNCTEIFQNTKPNTYKFRITFDDGSQVSFDENQLVTLDNGVTKKAKLITSLDRLNGKQIFITDKERIDGETAVCNLASLNLSKVNTKEDMERVIPIAVRMLDNVIDLNFYPSAKVKKTNLKTRAVGFGVMGEAQFLAENKIHFGSQEHFDKIDEVMEIFSYNTILASHEISKEKGSYATFKGSNWSKGIFPVDIANESAKDLVNRDRVYDWDVLREKVKTGIRNGYLMAIAPTSSISILVGTTQAIEPIYKRKWFEENMSGLIPVVAPNLSAETWEYYIPSFEVDQVKLIKAAAIRQKWIDQGQSTNVFVPSETTGKTLHQIYVTAWKLGNKSTYYLRSQSPSAKGAEHKKPDVVDRTMECSGCQ